MGKDKPTIYQFKVSLERCDPPIWRRIQLSAHSTFWDLHVALQDAMGWEDKHLHCFHVPNDSPSRFDQIAPAMRKNEFTPAGQLDSVTLSIAGYFGEGRPHVRYVYDFGDDWAHQIVFEQELTAVPGTTYPVCLDGKRACPPEDCGGAPGYEDLLPAIDDATHPEHKSRLAWLGRDWDPNSFDPRQVQFSDPQERLRQVLGGM